MCKCILILLFSLFNAECYENIEKLILSHAESHKKKTEKLIIFTRLNLLYLRKKCLTIRIVLLSICYAIIPYKSPISKKK